MLSVLSVALVARHQRREILVAHRDSLMEGAGKRRASRQILQQRDDGSRATLLDQAPHGPCGRRVRDFSVAPGETDEAAVQRR